MTQITHNLAAVRQRIVTATRSYGRNPDSVHLLAVSKTHEVQAIAEVVAENQLDFGENFANEAIAKQSELPDSLSWHFIGRIQSNKARQIAGHFDWVHSVDRGKIARRLSRFRGPGTPLRVFIQVNFLDDETRPGIHPDQAPALAEEIELLSGLDFVGLMTMAPLTDNFDEQSAVFKKARELRDQLLAVGHSCHHLSMGMSGDMEAAIANGATWLRIGTDIFGKRNAD